ncbi:MAG: substrate-binding domain-containing protein [Gaiellaceae bacterium]
MSAPSESRLSPDAVWQMLEESSALETTTSVDAAALAASHERGIHERVIGVAMNLDFAQIMPGQSGSTRHPFFDEVLFGMDARARAGDVHLLLLTTRSGAATGLGVPYLELCAKRRLDGIVFISFPPEEPGLIEVMESDLPCVAIDTHVFGPRSTFVISDNVGGGSAAVHHLASLGRRRIAFIGGTGPERASVDRRLGYESAVIDCDLEPQPDYIVHAHWNHREAHAQTQGLLKLPEPPDAIFCASDVMAIGALCAIEEAGLRVPEDVALVGFDDSDLARLITPSLTSVRQDVIGLGTTAIEVLLRIVEEPGAPLPAPVLPVELEIRESSAGRVSEPERQRARGERPKEDSEKASGDKKGRRLSSVIYRELGAAQSLAAVARGRSNAEWSHLSKPASERRVVALAMLRTPDQAFRRAFLDDICCAIRVNAFHHDIDLLTLSSVTSAETRSISLLERCRRHGAAGVIVVSLPYDDPETTALADSELPCVTIDIDLLGSRAGFVMSDNVSGAVQAVRHLAERGCMRIAFLNGYGVERVCIDRRFGYQSELARLGLEQRQEYLRLAKWDHGLAYQETRRLLELPAPPDGIFAASDVMAIGALKAVIDMGLRVPEDVAVVGFDDIEYARLLTPSLTTVRQNRANLAGAAVEALLQMLEQPEEAPPVSVLPVDLVVRESTG